MSAVMVLGPILRARDERVKNKSYQQCGVGRHIARYLRTLRWAAKSDKTLDSYETCLARLAIEHDDYDGIDSFCTPVGTEYLRDFLDRNWGDSAPATKANRIAAIHGLFTWGVNEGVCPWDPSKTIKAPKVRAAQERVAYSQDTLYAIVRAQDSLRDQCAIQLMGRMGLRKNELRVLRVGEIDLIRNLLTVHGKGGVVSVLPLAFKSLRDDLYLHIQGDECKHDEYLLYPRNRRRSPMDPSSLHRWFKQCLQNAGLPETMKLHELRHTAADNLYRGSGNIVQAQQLLRHSSVTTTQAYLHPTRRDLSDALEALDADWVRR